MFVAKVVLGNVWNVYQHRAVDSCPVGYDSVRGFHCIYITGAYDMPQVVFDKQNGQLNETVVYHDEAIRPIYLIIFG
jgi:hypothetical protein